MPAFTRSHLAPLGIEAEIAVLLFGQLADNDRTVDPRILGDKTRRNSQGTPHDLRPDPLVLVLGLKLVQRAAGIEQGDAVAGAMPSSTAARVACMASSTRSLRSFTSTSVAPPTRMMATSPASLAGRSCSFSRS
jgi:hypothetical protein